MRPSVLTGPKKRNKDTEEALTESQDYNTAYLLVRKAFGFKRSLAPAETTIVDEWCKYNFDSTILEEACKRTVLQTGETNFHYAGSILKKWHEQNVTCLQDIEKQDQAFKEKKKRKRKTSFSRDGTSLTSSRSVIIHKRSILSGKTASSGEPVLIIKEV